MNYYSVVLLDSDGEEHTYYVSSEGNLWTMLFQLALQLDTSKGFYGHDAQNTIRVTADKLVGQPAMGRIFKLS